MILLAVYCLFFLYCLLSPICSIFNGYYFLDLISFHTLLNAIVKFYVLFNLICIIAKGFIL